MSQFIESAPYINSAEMGSLIVLTGPSGSGKTTIAERLQNSGSIKRIITCTTRSPRDGEVDGRDYIFLSEDEFLSRQIAGEFAESVDYSGNHYGVLKSSFDPILQGENRIWLNDMSRAVDLDGMFAGFENQEAGQILRRRTKVVLIGVSRLLQLKGRYGSRESNPDRSKLVSRLRRDWEVWQANKEKFENIVINDNGHLDQTVDTVASIINSQ